MNSGVQGYFEHSLSGSCFLDQKQAIFRTVGPLIWQLGFTREGSHAARLTRCRLHREIEVPRTPPACQLSPPPSAGCQLLPGSIFMCFIILTKKKNTLKDWFHVIIYSQVIWNADFPTLSIFWFSFYWVKLLLPSLSLYNLLSTASSSFKPIAQGRPSETLTRL